MIKRFLKDIRNNLISITQSIKIYYNYRLKGDCLYFSFGQYFDSKTQFGSHVTIGKNASIRESLFGDYTSIGRNNTIWYSTIGKFCSIASNVIIGAAAHPTDHLSTHGFPYIKKFEFVNCDDRIITKTTIGHDVWIGANAVIIAGVNVGNGAVIGAGAVVTKNVAPYTIVAGVPAKDIRKRFDNKTIKALEQLEWWHWDRKKLLTHIDLFKRPLTEVDFQPYLDNSPATKTAA